MEVEGSRFVNCALSDVPIIHMIVPIYGSIYSGHAFPKAVFVENSLLMPTDRIFHNVRVIQTALSALPKV